jgi:hypothetical protein
MSCNVIKRITKYTTTDLITYLKPNIEECPVNLEGAFKYLKEESTSKTSEMIVPWQSANGRKEEPSIGINHPEQ